MTESRQLAAARQHLSQAESGFRTQDGLFHLEEGLKCLEEVLLDGEVRQRAIAANLLTAYSTRICEAIRELVEADGALPEPVLEHLFKVLLAFDSQKAELPGYVRSLKIDVVKRLVDLYYEGHPAAEKQKVLRQLAGMSDDQAI